MPSANAYFVSGLAAAIIAGLGSISLRAEAAEPPKRADPVHELMLRDLEGVDGKELRMITVDIAPGAKAPPHRHNAQVFVYVLEGSVRMQIQGSPAVVLTAGQTFYEGPNDIHLVSANTSQTQPARILVFMVKVKGAPSTTEVKAP
jgi:quercetin dioxygenase-like cupin family protein